MSYCPRDARNRALQASSWAQPIPPDQLAKLQKQFMVAFHGAMLTCAAIAAIGIITSLQRPASVPPTEPAFYDAERAS